MTVKPITKKTVSKATNASYRFRRKGVPAKLHLRLLKHGEPRANESYRVDIDGKLSKGVTDSQGFVDIYIPCNAKKGKLWVGPPEDEKMYTLQLGPHAACCDRKGCQAAPSKYWHVWRVHRRRSDPGTKTPCAHFRKKMLSLKRARPMTRPVRSWLKSTVPNRFLTTNGLSAAAGRKQKS